MSTVPEIKTHFKEAPINRKTQPKNGIVQLVTLLEPRSTVSEAYRILKTNLTFKNVEGQLKYIAVTSSLPGEGKTTTAANLAITLAQGGKKVFLVDADLRKPTLHKIFGLGSFGGLTNLLIDDKDPLELAKSFENYSLKVLTAGPLPPNSSELLASRRMKTVLEQIGKVADFVIIDCPPTLGLNDVLVLAPVVDGYLMVVGSGKVPRNALRQAKEQLEKVGANLIGAIVNNVDLRHTHGSYYYYSDYGEHQ